ncbi:MAG: hypothetical protein EBT13_01960 [Rhodobacteraceae bacterium]|nr:hypothetical protein [Paracoccaceae bacterium]
MSDSAQNIEIEDVLSSIRRLVSGDEWARPQAMTAEQPAPQKAVEPQQDVAEPAPKTDKFVLTPVLRVITPEDADQEKVVPADSTNDTAEAAENESVEFRHSDDIWHSEIPTSDSESLVHDQPVVEQEPLIETAFSPEETLETEEWPAETDEAEAATPAEVQEYSRDEQQIEVESEAEPETAEAVADAQPDTGDAQSNEWEDVSSNFEETTRRRLTAMIADLEAAVGSQQNDWEPDGTEEDISEQRPVQETQTESGLRIFRRPIEVEKIETEQVGPEEEVVFHHVDPDFVSPEHLDELADVGGNPNGLYGSEIDEDMDSYLDPETVLDEAVLREIVADIVRQELQGVLGERITRNVRKLVRREIYRVLAAREFE